MNIKTMLLSCEIFKKYIDDNDSIFHSEHDLLFGPDLDVYESFSDEDKQSLEELGWISSSNYDRLIIYCSC